jgi:hypothetical protein
LKLTMAMTASQLTAVRKYQTTEKGKSAAARAESKRRKNSARREYMREYYKLPHVKASRQLYANSPAGKIVRSRAKAKYRADGKQRVKDLYQRYGLSVTDYAALLQAQVGTCAICGKPSVKPLHVDHNHTTGSVRGLLCFKCNSGLGMFSDNVQILLKAVAYLRKHAEVKEDYVI